MNIIEKLNKIKAECERLLALAEKRTPGKWFSRNAGVRVVKESEFKLADVLIDRSMTPAMSRGLSGTSGFDDAEFIAACAGPAESGWRATIAAIDGILPMLYVPQVEASNEYLECCEHYSNDAMEIAKSIIAAWEGLV